MTFRYRAEKNKRVERLDLNSQLDFLDDLLNSLAGVRSAGEMAKFLVALMTEAEVKNLAKRLRMAKLLVEGKTYNEIVRMAKVSHASVAKVSGWISNKTEILESVLRRLPKKRESKHWTDYTGWDKFKRAHPLYFWPELLGEGVDRSLEKSRREGLKSVLGSLAARTSHDREYKEEYAEELRNRKRPRRS